MGGWRESIAFAINNVNDNEIDLQRCGKEPHIQFIIITPHVVTSSSWSAGCRIGGADERSTGMSEQTMTVLPLWTNGTGVSPLPQLSTSSSADS